MSKAESLRKRVLGAAVRATVENLEQRQMLAAGAFDPSFGFATGAVFDGQGTVTTSIYDTTAGRGGHWYDWQDRLAFTQGSGALYGMTIDVGGKIVTAGTQLGRHLYATDTEYVITNPEKTAETEKVKIVEFFDTDININRYNLDGTSDGYQLVWGNGGRLNPKGDRDYQSIMGTYPIPDVSAMDYARAVATDTDGSIIIAGTTGGTGGARAQLLLARYFTRPGMVSQLISMQAFQFGGVGPWSVNAMKLQSDGKILVAGSIGDGNRGADFTVWRFNSDFTLDTTFNGSGYSRLNFQNSSDDEAMALAVEPETLMDAQGRTYPNPDAGKIVVIGYQDDTTWSGNGKVHMVLMRYNANGTLDTTFGNGGRLGVGDFGGKNARGCDVAIQRDGRIVVVGTYDGSPTLESGLGAGYDSWQTGGYDTTIVIRYNANGTVDEENFGARGKFYITSPTGGTWVGQRIALESSGKIVVAGITNDGFGGATYAATVRLTADGRLDASYGTGGFETISRGNGYTGIHAQNDGNVSADWYSRVSLVIQPSDDKAVVGFNTDTLYDVSGGYFGLLPATYFGNQSYVVRIQADNRVPQAELQTKDMAVTSSNTTSFDLTVTYTDETLIDFSTIARGNVQVTAPNGDIWTPTSFDLTVGGVDVGGNSNIITVVYHFDVPAGYWTTNANNGPYLIDLNGGSVRDIQGQAVPSQTLGQFTVSIATPDTRPPVATIEALPRSGAGGNLGITIGGGSLLEFSIRYEDQGGGTVRLATLGDSNLLISGPNFFSAMARLVGVTNADGTPATGDATVLIAHYRLTAPGGTWDVTDNGQYTINMQTNQVSDNNTGAPNYVLQGPIDTFSVAVSPSLDIEYVTAAVVAPSPLATQWQVTLQFINGFTPTTGTLGVADLTLSSGTTVLEATSFTPNGDGTVTYTFNAPNGSWDSRANGTWTVRLNEAEISGEIAGPPAASWILAQKTLGTFAFSYQPPIAALVSYSATTGANPLLVTVTYTGAIPLDLTSIANGNLTVTRTDGGAPITLTVAATAPVVTSNGNTVTVVYSFLPPGGYWEYKDNGTYTAVLGSNQVKNTSGQAAVQTAFLPFTVAIAPDTAGPTVAIVQAPDVTDAGVTSYVFTVRFTDTVAIDPATIGNGNLKVVSPTGQEYDATLVAGSITPTGYAGEITAMFRVAVTFTDARNGAWTIVTGETNRVRDVSGNPASPNTNIGSFNVQIPDSANPVASLESAPSPIENSTTYSLIVRYTDAGGIDIASLTNANLVVSRTTGTPLTLTTSGTPATTIVTTGAGGIATEVLVTYTFTAPGGTWNYADNGAYSVAVAANQVRDMSGNAVNGGAIGSFSFTDTKPTAKVVQVNNPTGTQPLQVTVEYTDPGGVDPASIDANDISVTRINRGDPVVLISAAAPTPGTRTATTLRVTYTFLPRGGYWDGSDRGQYRVYLNPDQVLDVGGQAADAGTIWIRQQNAGDIAVIDFDNNASWPLDAVGPVGKLSAAIAAVTAGQTTVNFTVTFTDATAIDYTTIGSGNFTVTAPDGSTYVATLVSNPPTTFASSIQATYQITRPGGFTVADNGAWTITLNTDAVMDVSGNSATLADASNNRVDFFRFQVNLPVPPVQATLLDVRAPETGDSVLVFRVRYNADYPLDIGSLRSTTPCIRVGGPRSFSQVASVVELDSDSVGPTRIVTYSVAAPAGRWDFTGNGTYTFSVLANNAIRSNISSSVHGVLPAGALGTYAVNLSAAVLNRGSLVISGSDYSDNIEVSMNGDKIRAVVNNVASEFLASLVTSIEINAMAGNDTIKINAGVPAAFIEAGDGNDSIWGGAGADTIYGGLGADYINGGRGDDLIYGGDSNDVITGGAGNDSIFGERGADSLHGNGGADSISGGAANDTLNGGAGRDELYGDDGNDIFYSRDSERDTLFGGAGTNKAQVDSRLDRRSDIQVLLA